MLPGGAAEHALGLDAHGKDALVVLIDGNHGGLANDDALAADRDQRVGGAEVDGEVAGILAKKHIRQRKQSSSPEARESMCVGTPRGASLG